MAYFFLFGLLVAVAGDEPEPSGQHVCTREVYRTHCYTRTWWSWRASFRYQQQCCEQVKNIQHYCCPGYININGTCHVEEVCSKNNGGCDQICHCDPSGSGSVCECWSGYQLIDRTKCTDVDECATNNGGCDQHCHNVNGSFMCSCDDGYMLTSPLNCSEVDLKRGVFSRSAPVNIGAIAGGIIASLILSLLVIAGVVYWKRRAKAQPSPERSTFNNAVYVTENAVNTNNSPTSNGLSLADNQPSAPNDGHLVSRTHQPSNPYDNAIFPGAPPPLYADLYDNVVNDNTGDENVNEYEDVGPVANTASQSVHRSPSNAPSCSTTSTNSRPYLVIFDQNIEINDIQAARQNLKPIKKFKYYKKNVSGVL